MLHKPTRINPQFDKRFEQARRYLAATFSSAVPDLKRYTALEIGCGAGPKACAFAPMFKHYVGIDIDANSIREARRNANTMGVQNVEFENIEAKDLQPLLASGRFNFIILYAVIEHLTIEERLNTLRWCWESLPADGVLVVGEAPNRIAPLDYHSSRLPYFNLLPPELATEFMDHSSHENWQKRVRSESSLALGLFRNGMHVSFHEFEAAIARRNELANHIIADNFSVENLNMNPLRWFELQNLENFEVMEQLGEEHFPAAFSRYWIDFILSKSSREPLARPSQLRVISSPRNLTTRDRLGTSVYAVDDQRPLFLEGSIGGSLLIGLSRGSVGSLTIATETGEQILIDTASLMKVNEGLWDLQSWAEVSIRQPCKRIEINVEPGGQIGLLPVLSR